MSITTLRALVGGRVVVFNTRAYFVSVAILALGLLYACSFKEGANTAMLFRRCLGPEHDLKRFPWYFSARAPSANGGVGCLQGDGGADDDAVTIENLMAIFVVVPKGEEGVPQSVRVLRRSRR